MLILQLIDSQYKKIEQIRFTSDLLTILTYSCDDFLHNVNPRCLECRSSTLYHISSSIVCFIIGKLLAFYV